MLLASGLTVAFLIAGLSAYRWLKGDHDPSVATGLRFGVGLGAVLIPLQILAGDLHGINTLEHQPQKVAAMEGNWETRAHAPLLLFALPDAAERTNRFEIGVPSGASLILKHDPAGVVPGLNDYVSQNGTVLHPPVGPVFWSFRVMVGVGLLMLLTAWGGLWLWWRRGAENLPRPYLAWLTAMTFSGWVATLAGWYVTEIGRQPWLVQGVLTTAEAVGPVAAGMVLTTLLSYLAVYALLLAAYVGALFHLASRKQGFAPASAYAFQPAGE
jgi:cytochrome d ubiquinol oxidase subunit I